MSFRVFRICRDRVIKKKRLMVRWVRFIGEVSFNLNVEVGVVYEVECVVGVF